MTPSIMHGGDTFYSTWWQSRSLPKKFKWSIKVMVTIGMHGEHHYQKMNGQSSG
jgi:hypothetical protein